MFPSQFFNLFPPFPRNLKVFVAMSFDKKFDARWEDVIKPTIEKIEINGIPLEPYRVDVRKVSDSILTEILDGISNSYLVLADITTIGTIDGKSIRNGNVMYEVGIAHAVRLPEEVILVKSDKDEILFDIANVRVNQYNPEQPDQAIEFLTDLILSSIRETDLRKQLAIKGAVKSLDANSAIVLLRASQSVIKHPATKNMGQVLVSINEANAINRLLEIGALEFSPSPPNPELLKQLDIMQGTDIFEYNITSFGKAILHAFGSQMVIK